MGLFSKIVDTVKDAYDGTIGDIINPSNAIVREVTGLSNTEQLSAGALGGTAIGALAGGSEGSLIANLLGEKGLLGGLNSFASSISSGFGSIGSGLSGLGSALGSGISGLGSALGSALGSGISGLGSALLSGVGDYFNLSQQWKYQKQAMELQDAFNKAAEKRQWHYNLLNMGMQNKYNIAAENRAMQNNIQLWNMQNEYNTPAAQMQRLTDAGLNPNLAYGSANTTAGSISSPGTGSVSSHGVSTRATKALVRQAMALNYQQIQSNQLQNLMMAEQIADRRANRLLSIEQHPLDMAYRQAQIDAIKNGIDIRGGELGISGANLILSQEKAQFDREKLAWDKYQDDLKNYYNRESEIPISATLVKKFLPRAYNNFMGRRPMWMDYDRYYKK